jgi:phage-related protein
MSETNYLKKYQVVEIKFRRFDIVFLEPAIDFLDQLDLKTRRKIYYRLDRARFGLDSRLFKKLTDSIWEFRIGHRGLQFRLFAFWDRSDKNTSLVICTHGIVKKTNKVSPKEIDKATKMRENYFKGNYGRRA